MEQKTLRDVLVERGIKMDAAAVLASVSASTISRICSGTENARPKTVTSLAKALGMSARRMQALCDASWEAAHPADPHVNEQWSIWTWTEEIGLWVRVDEGPRLEMQASLNRLMKSAAGTFAISKTGEQLPKLPALVEAPGELGSER